MIGKNVAKIKYIEIPVYCLCAAAKNVDERTQNEGERNRETTVRWFVDQCRLLELAFVFEILSINAIPLEQSKGISYITCLLVLFYRPSWSLTNRLASLSLYPHSSNIMKVRHLL
jgi:hypothetical protein